VSFDAMAWELDAAGLPGNPTEKFLLITGLLASMADSDGVVSTDPELWTDNPKASELAETLRASLGAQKIKLAQLTEEERRGDY
jgi:hypothetical protein